jgi:hypothetical protein
VARTITPPPPLAATEPIQLLAARFGLTTKAAPKTMRLTAKPSASQRMYMSRRYRGRRRQNVTGAHRMHPGAKTLGEPLESNRNLRRPVTPCGADGAVVSHALEELECGSYASSC